MKPEVFSSKVDTWLAAVLVVSSLVCIAVAVALMGRLGPADLLFATVLLLVGAVLPLWVLTSTRYTLRETELKVVSGPFRWRIPLRDIHALRPTRNPLSSPALSLDRLRIDYGRRSMMISPRDKDAFLRALERRRANAGLAGSFNGQ